MSEPLEGERLDVAIAQSLGWKHDAQRGLDDHTAWYTPAGVYYWTPPGFHRSLDAILEHCEPVLRERGLRIHLDTEGEQYEGGVWVPSFDSDGTGWFELADTPALALARAVLRALTESA